MSYYHIIFLELLFGLSVVSAVPVTTVLFILLFKAMRVLRLAFGLLLVRPTEAFSLLIWLLRTYVLLLTPSNLYFTIGSISLEEQESRLASSCTCSCWFLNCTKSLLTELQASEPVKMVWLYISSSIYRRIWFWPLSRLEERLSPANGLSSATTTLVVGLTLVIWLADFLKGSVA